MRARWCQSLTCFAALMSVTLSLAVPPLFSASSASGPVPRWARFELHQQDSDGDLQTGKPLTLLITLGGVTSGPVPIIALCESILFEPQIITLEQDGETSTLKAGSHPRSATHEPDLCSSESRAHSGHVRQIASGKTRADHEAYRLRDLRSSGASAIPASRLLSVQRNPPPAISLSMSPNQAGRPSPQAP